MEISSYLSITEKSPFKKLYAQMYFEVLLVAFNLQTYIKIATIHLPRYCSNNHEKLYSSSCL